MGIILWARISQITVCICWLISITNKDCAGYNPYNMKTVRTLLVTALLFCSSAVAHLLGTGIVKIHFQTIFSLLIVSLFMILLLGYNLSGPKLALAILFSQSSFHFIINSDVTNQFKMLSSHIIGGFISYHLINCLQFLNQGVKYFSEIILSTIFNKFSLSFLVAFLPIIILSTGFPIKFKHIHLKITHLRAPPLLISY